MDHKRIPDYPAWILPHLRKDKLGLPLPPRKPELRTPVYWLSWRGDEVYFVNASQLTLDNLTSNANGWFTADEDVGHVTSGQYQYTKVLPNEGVLVESFHPILDSDFHFQLNIHIYAEQHGHIEMLIGIDMRNKLDAVLLWENGDKHKHLGLIKHPSADL